MVPVNGIPALRFPSLHGKVWMSSVFPQISCLKPKCPQKKWDRFLSRILSSDREYQRVTLLGICVNYASRLAGFYVERWYHSLDFPSLHGKVWMSSVFSFFPGRLCFAVTVHRSQGQTLDRVVFYLRRDVFMNGCLYVGLSPEVRRH